MDLDPFDPSSRTLWRRFAIASAVIVALMAAATASTALLELKHIQSFFKKATLPASAQRELTRADVGAAQTILLIGSDKRAQSTAAVDRNSPPHSDTLMLLRLDPDRGQVSVLSIPRDLKVVIGGRVQKINAAYSIGGPRLAAAVIKQTLPGLQINHIVDVNFRGFRRVIDAIGCVYVFVDRRYFHSNAGLPASLQYSEINVQPGYQRLCGQTALDYSRYRHTDSDFVRVARQQDVVRQLRTQVSALGLLNHQDQLLKALQRAVHTDIHGGDITALLELAAFSLDKPMRQVPFAALPGPSYVTATAEQLRATVSSFLRGRVPKHVAVAARPRRHRTHRSALGLSPVARSDVGRATAAAIGSSLKVEVPRLVAQSSFAASQDVVRRYTLHDQHGRPHRAYAISFARGLAGEYFGVEGTDWMNPPALDHPAETRTIGARTYLLFTDGGKLRVVAWRTPNAVYWVNNTLTGSLSNQQMLAIAQSAQPVA